MKSCRQRYKKGGLASEDGQKYSNNSSRLGYTSEPVAASNRPRPRPTPPKKPLRLSLQRSSSLQTIEVNAAMISSDLEKKRALKRTYRGNKTPDYDGEINLLYVASNKH